MWFPTPVTHFTIFCLGIPCLKIPFIMHIAFINNLFCNFYENTNYIPSPLSISEFKANVAVTIFGSP
jgi:hypothetical protein